MQTGLNVLFGLNETSSGILYLEVVDDAERKHQQQQQVTAGQVDQEDGGWELLGAEEKHPQGQQVCREAHDEGRQVDQRNQQNRFFRLDLLLLVLRQSAVTADPEDPCP